MQRVCDGWVRQVTSRYFGRGLVSITNRCKFITVEDCAHLDPKSTLAGGNRYSFNIDDVSYVLFQRCLTRGGRHDFVSGSMTPGPNAFVDGLATEALNDIGPHHRYATGQIYDNIKTEFNPDDDDVAINVQNRTTSGSGHGWSGAQIMFWNCVAPKVVCDAPVGAMNWAIGIIGEKTESRRSPNEPFGIWESHESPVLPRSLYYAQVKDRLGPRALQSIILPTQLNGPIWKELARWDGNGLFGDPIIGWTDPTEIHKIGQPQAIYGVVRRLSMLDRGASYAWSKVSGPGKVLFKDATALVTLVVFSQPGSYVLQLYANAGKMEATAQLEVEVVDREDS
jgi:hypothetical protein